MPGYDDEDFDPALARRLTEDAIRQRAAEVIYQPYLVSADGRWRGFADFLERTPAGTYEPVDTKLARSAKPSHLLQLLFYAEQVERLQGAPVERVHVENGRGERESFRVAEFQAYYRRVRWRFLDCARARGRDLPLAVRALRDLRLSEPLPREAGGGRPPRARRRDAAGVGGAADGGRH